MFRPRFDLLPLRGRANSLSIFYNNIMIGIDADVRCNMKGGFGNLMCTHIGVGFQGTRRRQGVIAAGADRRNPVTTAFS